MADLANVLLTSTRREPSISHADYDSLLRSTVETLRSHLSLKGGKRIEDAELLQVLHPSLNTIGYTFLLNYLVLDQTSDVFIIALSAYLTQFDPVQVRYTGPEFRRVLELTDEVVRTTKNTELLDPLRGAILKLDPNSSTFTSNHHLYVSLCLAARQPRRALPILDNDLIDFPNSAMQNVDAVLPCEDGERSSRCITKQSGISRDITVLMVQEYHLLGAHVYIGLRRYERARLFLELVISTPNFGHAIDMFMVEAYKKLVLIGLVSKGAMQPMGSLLDQGSLRIIQHVSKAYDALAKAFRNRDLLKFSAEVETAGSLWADEGNWGLVQEASESLRRHRVIDLQRTYASLPVQQVATILSLSADATHSLLQSMIAHDQLQASIIAASKAVSGSAGSEAGDSATQSRVSVLVFHDWTCSTMSKTVSSLAVGTLPTAADGLQQAEGQQMQAQMHRIEVLSEAVKEADRRLALTREYGDWLRRNSNNNNNGNKDSQRGMDIGAAAFEDPMEMDDGDRVAGGTYVDDEDIMAA